MNKRDLKVKDVPYALRIIDCMQLLGKNWKLTKNSFISLLIIIIIFILPGFTAKSKSSIMKILKSYILKEIFKFHPVINKLGKEYWCLD